MRMFCKRTAACLIFCLAFGCLGGFSTAGLAEALELVKDGGFEAMEPGAKIALMTDAGFKPQLDTFSVGNASSAEVSDEMAHTGRQSMKVTHDVQLESGREVGINYYTKVEANRKYRFSAWVRLAPDATQTSDFYIRLSDTGFAWDDRGLAKGLTKDSDFTKVEAVYIATASDAQKATVRVNIGMTAQKGTIAYIDDVSCLDITDGEPEEPEKPVDPEKPQPEEGNFIANAGFEEEVLPKILTPANCNAVRTAETAHSGEYSYKLEQTANYGAANYTPIALTPGKTYYYRVWARLEENNEKSTNFYIRLLWNNGNGGQMYSQMVSGKDGWVLAEGISTIPVGDSATACRLNIAANPISNQPTTFYIDDVLLTEVTGTETVLTETIWNKVGQQGELPVCPTETEVTLTFDHALRTESLLADCLLLNNSPISSDCVSVIAEAGKPNQAVIRLNGLSFSKRYTLSFAEGWKDLYGRSVTLGALPFKTAGRVAVGTKKIYLNNTEVTNGKIADGTFRAEIGNLKNLCAETANVTAILVLYQDGKMVGASSETVKIAPNESGNTVIKTELSVQRENSGSYQLKLFVWDDLQSGLTLTEETVLQ